VICPFSSETWIYASDLSHWNVKGEIIAVFHGDAAYLLLNEIVMFKPVSLLVVTESWVVSGLIGRLLLIVMVSPMRIKQRQCFPAPPNGWRA
jgi:hypothetical protein